MCLQHITQYESCEHTATNGIKLCPDFHRLISRLGFVAILQNGAPKHCGRVDTKAETSGRCELCTKRKKRELTSRSERTGRRSPEPTSRGKHKPTSKKSNNNCITGALKSLFGSSRDSNPRPADNIRVLRETAQGTVPQLRMKDPRPDAPLARSRTHRIRERTPSEPRGRTRHRDAPSGESGPTETRARPGGAPYRSAGEPRTNICVPEPPVRSPNEPRWPFLSGENDEDDEWPPQQLGQPVRRREHVRVHRSPGGTRRDPRERIAQGKERARASEVAKILQVPSSRPVVTRSPSVHSLRAEVCFAGDESSPLSRNPVARKPVPLPSTIPGSRTRAPYTKDTPPTSEFPTRKPIPPPRTSRASPSVAFGSGTQSVVPPIRTAFVRETGYYEFTGAELEPSINPAVANRSVSPVSPSSAPRRSVSPISVRQPSVRKPTQRRAEREPVRRPSARDASGRTPTRREQEQSTAPGASYQVRLPVQPIVPAGSSRHPTVSTPPRSEESSRHYSTRFNTTREAARQPLTPPSSGRMRDSMMPKPLSLRRVKGSENLTPSRLSRSSEAESSQSKYVPNPIFANQSPSRPPAQSHGLGGFLSPLRSHFPRERPMVSDMFRRMLGSSDADDDTEWVCKSSSEVERGGHR